MNVVSPAWFGDAVPPAISPKVPGGATVTETTAMPALVRYWRIAVRRKWLIAAIALGFLVAGLVATLLMTPQYTASATIEIARQQDRVVEVDDVKPESSFVDQEFYQTQYSLLQARTLAETVATQLRLVDNKAFFEAFDVDPDDRELFGAEARGPLTREQRAIRQRRAVKILLDNIGISPTRGSRLVTVSFTSPDAALSARIVNTWTANFIKQNLARRYDATAYARNFLEQRLNQLRQRLEESERALVAYAGREQIINIPSTDTSDTNNRRVERPLIADDLATLNTALVQATADRIRAASRTAGQAGSSAEALSNDAITGLRQQRAEVAAQYAKLLAQFEPAYPPAQALAAQLQQLDRSIAREESRIRQNLDTGYSEAAAREAGLRERVDALKNSLLDQRRRSIQYNIYQREADTNRTLYDGLLQRYKEIGVAGGVGSNNISVVDPAEVPERPSSPRLFINLLLSLLAGVALGVATAIILEQIDEAIRDPADVSNLTGLSLLGVVPADDGGDIAASLADRKSPQSEAYLSIRTSLQFSSDHGVPRSLAVTSTRAGEGKSTTAFALAQSLARTQRSVVLVDCDMRSPSVHHVVGIDNGAGTSNFLSGDEDLQAMMVPIEATGIHVISAGPQPPNAGELLTGGRMKTMIERLTGQFDHVVIDCPPVLGLADALLIASRTEGVVYAVEAHGARAGLIRSALTRLRSADVNLIGVVLTKFQASKAVYGYGYDYGYGYGKEKAAS